MNDTWFDTLTARIPGRAEEVVAAAEDRRINLRLVDPDHVSVTFDETSTEAIVAAVARREWGQKPVTSAAMPEVFTILSTP